jgi:metal-dependent HD superfamily phosphatase/phosphodiesterase
MEILIFLSGNIYESIYVNVHEIIEKETSKYYNDAKKRQMVKKSLLQMINTKENVSLC